MDENTSYVPKLTLNPTAVQAAVEEAPVEEQKEEEKEPVKAEKLDISSLSPAEQAAVREFSEQIDILNTEQVMNYGSAAQKNISEFSDAALNTVRTKDLGEVGDKLSDLVVELKGLNFSPEEKKGLKGTDRFVWDYEKCEYVPLSRPAPASLADVRDKATRLRDLLAGNYPETPFLRRVVLEPLWLAMMNADKISYDFRDIDAAMRG